ncbi:MAG: helix-turn-helix transcriptional regulator [Pseudomonadota bacterium]
MFVRVLRQRFRLSQERLAEQSGLSLRTIQRVEAGHRISYASLRALADVFEVDVDKLERELYAMDKTTEDYKELPLWVRLVLGRGWVSSSRRELIFTEVVLVVLGVLLFGVSIADQFWSLIDDPGRSALYSGLLMFVFAYLTSVCIRIGDRYAAWPLLGHTQPRRFFGSTEKD